MPRRRFVAALALYAVWLALLAGMIARDGRPPQDRRSPAPSSAPLPTAPR
jgi:hypothetical protein